MTVEEKEDQGSVDLCPGCMGEVLPEDHFCKVCMTPLDSFAATDPVRSIHAEFNVFNKAAKNAPTLTVVVGMWLIWGPVLLSAVLVIGSLLHSMFTAPSGIRTWGDVLGAILLFVLVFGILVALAFIAGKFLYSTTRSYVLEKRRGEAEEREESDGGIGDEWKSGGESGEV